MLSEYLRWGEPSLDQLLFDIVMIHLREFQLYKLIKLNRLFASVSQLLPCDEWLHFCVLKARTLTLVMSLRRFSTCDTTDQLFCEVGVCDVVHQVDHRANGLEILVSGDKCMLYV